jgi:hypothetical protein
MESMGLFFFLSVRLSHVSSLLSLMVNDLYLLGKLAWSHKTLRANSEYQISTSNGNAHDISRDFVKLATFGYFAPAVLAWPV